MKRRHTATWRAIAVAGIVGAFSAVAQGALPAGAADALSNDTLRRARLALQGHPAEAKVTLVPEAPTGGKASDTAYVLPIQARAHVALTRLASPRCDLLQAATNNVNTAIDSLTILAQAVLKQADHISEQLDAHAAFVLLHQADLALADEGYRKIVVAESVLAALEASLLFETDPTLIAIYLSEIAAAQKQLVTARTDPKYTAALGVKAQADALMDTALQEHESWSATYTKTLAAAELAIETARTAYDDLSTTELAAANARLPVWDADMLALFRAGVRGGIRFLPAQLEDMAWSIQDAEIPRMAPIEIEFAGTSQQKLNGAPRVETFPGLLEHAATKRMQPMSSADFSSAVTRFATGDLGLSWARETRALAVDAPLIRASVPLGSYCGSLQTVSTIAGSAAGPTASASLRVQRYQLLARKHAAVETYAGRADYRVQEQGLTTSFNCSVDLAQYAKVSQGKPVDVSWLWDRYASWDVQLLPRLQRLGLRCSAAELQRLRSAGMDGVLRDAAGWAAGTAATLLTLLNTALSTGTLPKSGPAPLVVSASDLRLAGQSEICTAGKCQLPGLMPVSAQLACRVLSPTGSCQGALLAGTVNWSPLFWQIAQLGSQLEFEMPAL